MESNLTQVICLHVYLLEKLTFTFKSLYFSCIYSIFVTSYSLLESQRQTACGRAFRWQDSTIFTGNVVLIQFNFIQLVAWGL